MTITFDDIKKKAEQTLKFGIMHHYRPDPRPDERGYTSFGRCPHCQHYNADIPAYEVRSKHTLCSECGARIRVRRYVDVGRGTDLEYHTE